MNISATLDKLNEFKCFGMHEAVDSLLQQPEAQSLSFEEKLGIIVDRESVYRENSRRKRLLNYAKLRSPNACVEQIDYRHERTLDRSKFISFTTCDWIRQQQNIIFTGPTGVGKTYIACALGQQACRQGLGVRYFRVPRLLENFRIAQAEGQLQKLMISIAKAELLILDDWGLGSLAKTERSDLLELLEDRYGLKSTIITTQLPVENWHEYIGDATIADAILDRVLSCAHRVELSGKSMRKMAEDLDSK